MAEFNLNNSKVEQLNDQGDNYKITGNQGAIAITQQDGQTTQVTGSENKLNVDKPKPNVFGKLWKKIKGWIGMDS